MAFWMIPSRRGIIDGITVQQWFDTVMATHKLSELQVRQAKPSEKPYKLTDGGGLYLLVQKNGTKSWRYDYRFGGKRKTLSIGTYPVIGLKLAREKLLEAKRLLSENQDPSQIKQLGKQAGNNESENSFAIVAKEWWDYQKGTWTADHADRVWRRMEADVLPEIGDLDIADLKPQEIIPVIRKIEARNALDVADRVLQDIRRICRYGVQTGRLGVNPAGELSGILIRRKTNHRPSLPREELAGFLKSLDTYENQGRLLTKLAIQMLVLTFVRSKELRGAKWDEFDFEEHIWRIPSSRMKMNNELIVPLSNQAIAVLDQIKPISGQYDLVFPSERNREDFMSDNTMRRAIFKLGYDGNTLGKSKAVPHGFRATASSILNEEGFNPDAIERQLSHKESNGVRAAYTHHARFLDERAKMMQWWADYLDKEREA